jgi:hypothetical protein
LQSNTGVKFKSIVLFNAESLTNDAQSALRRCIELFSINTRFFIIVENKNKLLNPILSRFCEIYIPEIFVSNKIINLHSETNQLTGCYNIPIDLDFNTLCNYTHNDFVKLSTDLYDNGYSCLDILDWIKLQNSVLSDYEISRTVLCFDKVRSEYRCDKLLMLYMFDYIFLRSNRDLKNVGFI